MATTATERRGIAVALAAALQQLLRQTVADAGIEVQTLPLAPEIALYLLSPDYPRGPVARSNAADHGAAG